MKAHHKHLKAGQSSSIDGLTQTMSETLQALVKAAKEDRLVLTPCTDSVTSEIVPTLCAMEFSDDGCEFVPLARLFDRDPHELLDPPDGDEEMREIDAAAAASPAIAAQVEASRQDSESLDASVDEEIASLLGLGEDDAPESEPTASPVEDEGPQG